MDDIVTKPTWSKDAKFALNLNKFIVWPLGLWPLECDDAFSWFRLVFAFVSQVWMIFVELLAVYQNCGGASDVVDYVMLSVCAVMALSKIVAIRVHMDKIRGIFFYALDDWISIDDKKSRDVVIPFAKTGRKVFFLQILSSYVSNTLIIIGTLPFLMPPISNETFWDNTTSSVPSRQLPLNTGCLFAHYRDEIYGFLHAYESITIMLTAHGNVGCDVFFFSLAMHLCGQIELLKTEVVDLGTKTEELTETRKRIAGFVQRHCRLLEMAKALGDAVSGMLVIQLLMNAGLNLMLGIRVIMAIKSGVTADVLRPIVAFNVLMLQLFLLSYASDRLSSQSESVVDAVYDSCWYELPSIQRRDLYFMAARSNKSIYLMAGQFYAMNIENFMNVLKASFSYFSILRVMFDG